MDLIWSISLILCGVLAASTLIVAKKPNAKELIDKLVPIQGILGCIVLLFGVWALINVLLNIGTYFKGVPMHAICFLAMALCMMALGFLLGFGLINKYVFSKGADAGSAPEAGAQSPNAVKAAELQAKIATYQIPLGLIGIGLGLWGLIGHFVR